MTIEEEIRERIANLIPCFAEQLIAGEHIVDIPSQWEKVVEAEVEKLLPEWLGMVRGYLADVAGDAVERVLGAFLWCLSPKLLDTVNAVLAEGGVSPVYISAIEPVGYAKPGGEAVVKVRVKNVLEEASIKVNICWETETSRECVSDIIPGGAEKDYIVRAKVGLASGRYPIKVYVTDVGGSVLASVTLVVVVPDIEEVCRDVARGGLVDLRQLLPIILIASVLRR